MSSVVFFSFEKYGYPNNHLVSGENEYLRELLLSLAVGASHNGRFSGACLKSGRGTSVKSVSVRGL